MSLLANSIAPGRPEVGWRNDSPNPGKVEVSQTARTFDDVAFNNTSYSLPTRITVYEVTLRNQASSPQFMEAWLTVPFRPKGDRSFWDGSELRKGQVARALKQEMQRQTMIGAFPMMCVYDASSGLAVGLEPSQLRSWFASDAEAGLVRYRTRTALAPGEADKIAFVSFAFKPDFGYRTAVQIYQDAFPRWFRPAPGIDPRVLTGCATGSAYSPASLKTPGAPIFSPAEIARRSHNLWEWCYAPFKYSGDLLGRPELWNLYSIPKNRPENQPLDAFEKARQDRFAALKQWGIASLFYFTNWIDEKLASRYQDALIDADNAFDRRGVRLKSWVKGYSTDLRAYWGGTSLGEATKQDMKTLAGMLPLSGFAHDIAVSGASYRGKNIWKSPGRAYDDKGVYVNEGVGIAWMFDYVHQLKQGQYRLACVANNTPSTYHVAFRVDNSIYEGRADEVLTNTAEMERLRLLHGSKPRCLYHRNMNFQLGKRVAFQNMSQGGLRALFRKIWDQTLLFCLYQGYYPSPDLVFGYKRASQMVKEIAEVVSAGWQPVPAMRTQVSSLWLARYGRDRATRLAILNPSETSVIAKVQIDQSWLTNRSVSFIFAPRDSSEISQTYRNGKTALSVKLPPYGALLLQPVAEVPHNTGFEVTASQSWQADRGEINIKPRSPEGLKFLPPPHYETAGGGRFRSVLFQCAEKDMLNFAFPSSSIVLSSAATPEQRQAAWRIQEYFRFWDAMENKNRSPMKLPIVEQSRSPHGRPTIRIESSSSASIRWQSGGKSSLIVSAPGGALAETLNMLLDALDKRYPVVGEWTSYLPGYRGNVREESTGQMLKKAGYPGPPLE